MRGLTEREREMLVDYMPGIPVDTSDGFMSPVDLKVSGRLERRGLMGPACVQDFYGEMWLVPETTPLGMLVLRLDSVAKNYSARDAATQSERAAPGSE